MYDLSSHSESLLKNVTSNCVESFNNVVAKMVSGKRVNYGMRDSYNIRVYAAVSEFNDQAVISKIYENRRYIKNDIAIAMETEMKNENEYVQKIRKVKPRRKFRYAPEGETVMVITPTVPI